MASSAMRTVLSLALPLCSWEILSAQSNAFAEASVAINEVAYRGSGESNCNGKDWIELINTDEAKDLTNYTLHDNKGADDEDAKLFGNITIAPGEYLVLCRDVDFGFGIGSDDNITLLDDEGVIVDSVALPGNGADDGSDTYSLFDGEYKYTATPTPGEANVLAKASILINEIAYKGSRESNCDGEDWIELLNTGEGKAVDLTNYTLHDDKGADNEDAKLFGNITIAPGGYLVLCRYVDFEFGIGEDDKITLLDDTGAIASSVNLPGKGADDGTDTYSLFEGGYKYTITPTPGETNIFTEMSLEEELRAQNDAGDDFFLVGDARTFSKVVDIHISVSEEGMSIIEDHPAWEEWVLFDELSVSNVGDPASDEKSALSVSRNSHEAVSKGGRIRVKGQSTNTMTSCIGQRNVPFSVEFDSPFMGMENVYLRNHYGDPSYMREHASHTMLKAFGLPYLRTRPVRLFLNGEYTGFYTLMEAPSQGYVMQRSFGAFDPEKTALFKAKTSVGECPYNDYIALAAQSDTDTGELEYFERGDHREDTPILPGDFTGCVNFFSGQLVEDALATIRGYLKHHKDCALAMVAMGRIDLHYGPKPLEEPTISFLRKFYDESVNDLSDSIDVDQWLQNLATYAVMLNVDSPMLVINNWYLATTEGGVGDWRIVQYDHNVIMDQDSTAMCSETCAPRMVYWPILRPTCQSIDDHKVVGRLLNSEENVRKYLDFIQKYMSILTKSDILGKMYAYGNEIKQFIKDDPFMTNPVDFGDARRGQYLSLEAYEESELGTNTEDFNSITSPFLKTFAVRLQEIQKQLDAIKEGTLPLNDVYDRGATCPDWRDVNSEDYISGATMAEDCAVPLCAESALCYLHCNTSPDGTFLLEECKFASLFCDSCFPFSPCGGGEKDPSGTFVESETCGSEFTQCVEDTTCFDHKSGYCAFDGEFLTVECQKALTCKPCFPYSRCGSGEALEMVSADTPLGDGESSLANEDERDAEEEDELTGKETPPPGALSGARSPRIAVMWILVLVTLGLSWCYTSV